MRVDVTVSMHTNLFKNTYSAFSKGVGALRRLRGCGMNRGRDYTPKGRG